MEQKKLQNEAQRMHERAKVVFQEFYDEYRIDGATALRTEKEWNELMDRAEKILNDSKEDPERHKALALSILNELDYKDEFSDREEN